MIELMAPAGNFAAMQAAIDAGADSVYFGVEQLSMRARSTMNFTLDDLEEVAARCAPKNVKTYITLNTIIYDHDLGLAKKIVDRAVAAGITAIIASDQAVIQYAKSKGMPVHISTQLNVTNIETVQFYSLFADVMVLSRELSVRQVQKIVEGVKKDGIRGPSGELVRIEIFAHGALCMAVSGKCYLSLHTQNSSANRGACIQNCRRKYRVVDIEGGHELEIDNEYIMSPKDLCTIDFLDQVIATGVSVLKIEGRGRAPEYVKTVIECYREAIDAYYAGTYNQEKIDDWMARLAKVYNRGFWSGYYLGQEMGEWTKKHGSSAQQKKVFLGKGIHYYPKAKVAHFDIDSYSLKVGDKVVIIGPTTGVVETEITELMVNSQKVNEATKGMDCTFPLEQLIRKSDKLYKLVDVEVEA
ncbi:peptidase U32 family protein [Aureispira sp. CCB-E]|uniref:peptidase U32 family protein n=1 Tax=Aureispira sp. CCB-E TaxID=3051121 RepID=UPI0028694037|nr:peptidase U32 family protein [Aureispira sp. CCB-E]WMX13076.1 peptidase U32 family protein [Aureispira sp. CCB-E]